MIPDKESMAFADFYDRGLLTSSSHFMVRTLPDKRQELHLRPGIVQKIKKRTIAGNCYPYEDFWPDYFTNPTNRWKGYCLRIIQFDWDSAGHAASNFRFFDHGWFDTGGPTNEISFWFTPSNAAIHNLLRTIPSVSPDILEDAGNQQVTLYLEMYRDVIVNPAPPPFNTPVSPNETDSIPFVHEICWASLP